jgi:curli biogenesis system outer membrane secretion channel CsgG
VASPDNIEDGEYVIDLLTTLLVDTNQFIIIDRHSLDVIRAEQRFQLSGDVDDNTAVSIGKMVGTNIVITGTIRYIPFVVNSYETGTRQLVLKALDVTTAQIIAMDSEV